MIMSADEKKYSHIIWDWNGTLLDDVDVCVEVLNVILTRYGKTLIDRRIYCEHFDFPVKGFYEKIGFDFSVESFPEVADIYVKGYEQRRFECDLFSRCRDIIEALRQKGMSQSILSAYHQDRLDEFVEKTGLDKLFRVVAGRNDYFAETKVDIGRQVMDSLGISPGEVLIIGDTVHDYEVADALGTDCVLLSCGHNSKERLVRTGAAVADSHDSLAELLNLTDIAGE